jgi:acyl-coenzyme A synthetase/AMP-(fatty) acid ligase
MLPSVLPLSLRNPDAWIAHCTLPLAALGGQLGPVRCADFMGQAQRLAEQLPAGKFAINLCENRYLFTLAFCAAIIKQQTTLLPQNRAEATQTSLFEQYAGAYVLHDGAAVIATDLPHLNISTLNLLGAPCRDIPQIDADFLAAIAFTSGSTGQPKANLKPWRTLVESSQISARFMLPIGDQCYSVLATVPAQHMWGLETSVLLPLFSELCVADSRPLFPQDIQQALAALPEPRLLISTPIHLRAMVLSGLSLPPVAHILCATAPLSTSLASDIEVLFQGELVEVFGCSEVGSMAYRHTAQQETWRLFDGLHFTPFDSHLAGSDVCDASLVCEGGQICEGATISAAHLPSSQILTDRIEWQGAQEFRLLGRSDDMIEIAGKRGSVQELNKLLLSAPGVTDGVVFMPEPDPARHKITRPAALVVAPSSTKADLVAHFAKHLDPVFIPRPLLLVESLPREENGKLPRGKLLAFFEQVRAR